MSLRSRLSTWLLAEEPKSSPDAKEIGGHGGGLVSEAYFGDVSARIAAYNPDRVSPATYEKMLLDPTIRACFSLLRYSIKTVPWDVEGPDHDVTEFVRAVIDPMWGHIVSSCVAGMAYGCAPHELVWQRGAVSVPDEESGEPRDVEGWSLSKVKDIKPTSLRSILVDGLENFAGYELTMPNGAVLEAEKSFHYAHDIQYGNFWGQSRLKPAYDAWYARSLLQALYLRFMERRVVPAVHVEFPPGFAADGVTPNATVARTIAEGFQSDSTAIWTESAPQGMETWTVQLIEDAARAQTAQAFLDGMKMLDLKMMTALLTPEKVLIGESGAYALSETHKDVWLLGVEGTAEDIVETVNDQLVPRIVRYTFGDAPAPRLVQAGLSEESRGLLGELLKAMIASAGSRLDLDGICERLDVPVLEGEAATEDQDETAGEMPEDVPTEPADEETAADQVDASGTAMADLLREAALLRDQVHTARLRLAARV